MSRKRLTTNIAVITALASAGLTGLVAAPSASAASSAGGTIDRSEVISRAKNWYDRNIQYSQTSYASDVDGGHTYRQDCSGFVSMAWHMTTSANTNTLPGYANTVSDKHSLKPGDALNDIGDGHVVLFVKWLDQSAGTFAFYEEANPSIDMEYGTGDVDSGNIAGWPASHYTGLRYKKIGADSPPPPPKHWTLHTLVTTSQRVYHAQRADTGTWTAFGNVEGQSGSIGDIAAVADAGISDDTHVLAVTTDGKLMHAIRYGDGSWSPFRNVEGPVGQLPAAVTDVAAVSIGQELHVAAVAGGKVYHTIRHADGTWDDWGNVYGKTGDAGVASAVSLASLNGELDIAVVVPGTVRNAVRHADGTWTQWGDVEGQAGDTGDPTDVAVAAVDGDLQMIVLSNGGTKYQHTLRHSSDGSWEPFRSLSVTLPAGLTLESVGAARVDDELQATFVTSDGRLLHTIRHSDGSWIDANSKALTGVTGTIVTTADTGTVD